MNTHERRKARTVERTKPAQDRRAVAAQLSSAVEVPIKQGNFLEIVNSERLLVLEAEDRYGSYYKHAAGASLLLSRFVKSVDSNGLIFVRFLSQVKKHHTLALFSTVRLHQIQAMMVLRHAVEAGAAAAYAMAHPDPAEFAETNELGGLDSTKALTQKRYRWLDEHIPDGSSYLKAVKKNINQSTAHASIVYTENNFRLGEDHASAPFFDLTDEYYIKTDLWTIGGVALGLMDLFYGVNAQYKVMEFIDRFRDQFGMLADQNRAIQNEMQSSERFQAIQQLYEDLNLKTQERTAY
jgi:hypothetical protein